jgi:large subunit ribosomal protein L21
MFAVIKTGGKQYRVAEDQMLEIEKIQGEPGQIIQLGDVLMLGGDQPQVGTPTISGASVAAEVVSQGRGPKIIAFKKRRRKNSRRKRGHRQEFTLIRITEILTEGAKPTKTARPKREKAPKPEADADAEGEGETKAAPRKRPAGKAKSAAKPKAAAKGKKK